MPSRDINDLCEELQPICKEFLVQCKAAGINAHISCTYRDNEEQTEAYKAGRSHAKAGQSPHNVTTQDGSPAARAFDIYIIRDDGTLDWDIKSNAWQRAGEIGEILGLTWGAEFKHLVDAPHFQIDKKFPIDT